MMWIVTQDGRLMNSDYISSIYIMPYITDSFSKPTGYEGCMNAEVHHTAITILARNLKNPEESLRKLTIALKDGVNLYSLEGERE